MELIADLQQIVKDDVIYQVYSKLNELMADDKDSILYYRFPLYTGDTKEETVEAELLLLSKEYGVICFTCCGSRDVHAVDFEGIDNLYVRLESRFKSESKLRKGRRDLVFEIRNIIICKQTDTNDCPEEFEYTSIEDLGSLLASTKITPPLSDELFSIIQCCVDGANKVVVKKERRKTAEANKKADILNDIQDHLANLDIQQKKAAIIPYNSPQRIRGLAGSGKTILLTQKAAYYHQKYKDAQILYTYYTKSLGGTIKEHISRAYRLFSNGKEPDWGKITICHGWGGVSVDGVYSIACRDNNCQMLSVQQARRAGGSDPFAYACEHLMRNAEQIVPKYDLILIDEGQDFPSAFYRLCYKLSSNKMITWAYDDFQNIFDVNIQNEKETFGKDENGNYLVDFSNNYNPLSDIVLKICYRTPKIVLTAAFCLGLGIYNKKGVLQRMKDNNHWESLGFVVERGNSNDNDQMVVSRPDVNTPAYSNKVFGVGTIRYYVKSSVNEECDQIARDIARDITEENLLHTDICVICIDDRNAEKYFKFLEVALNRKGIPTFNLSTAPSSNREFFREGYVTLSTVNRAKGNECGAVYICGSDYPFAYPNNIVLRDKLFTAMTRTKGWLTMTGCPEFQKGIEELNLLQENNFKMCFTQPSENNTKTIESSSRANLRDMDAMQTALSHLLESGMTKEEIQRMLFEKK